MYIEYEQAIKALTWKKGETNIDENSVAFIYFMKFHKTQS